MEGEIKKELIAELNRNSQRMILQRIRKSFFAIGNILPYKHPMSVSVLSIALDEQERLLGVFVCSEGIFRDQILLPNIIKCSTNKDAQQRYLYDQDNKRLMEFIAQANPQAILLVPQSMRINYFKQELVKNISQFYQEKGITGEIPFPVWSNFDLFQCFSFGTQNLDQI